MTGYIAYLKRGGKTFRLDADNFEIDAENFIPPATQEIPLLATGTSANRYGGSTKVSERALDVELSLPVVVSGRSETAVRLNAQRLTSFLKSGTKDNPVYFCWKGNDDVPYEPLWGQYGAPARYEIIHAGTPQVDDFYRLGDTRKSVAGYNATLLVKPYSQGLPQRLGSATGGVLEETWGTVDGRSRGLVIPEATTNLITNPIFGHATWDNDYTAASNITATENVDEAFVLFGSSSAKLTANGGLPAARMFTQFPFLAGVGDDYVLSAYVKLPDGGAVSATHCTMAWNAAEVTPDAYTEVGDGWWRITYFGTSNDTGYAVGLVVQDKYTVYADGFQVEAKTYVTPLCYGDLLHCSWAGIAHDSTSTRVAGRVRIGESTALDAAQGTIRVVWKAPYANTDLLATPDTWYLFDSDCGLAAYFLTIGAAYEWGFEDGTDTASTLYTPFAANEIIVFHFVYGPTGMGVYINGELASNEPDYTPVTPGSYLYIGSDTAVGDHINGTFLGFETTAVALTAVQVAADAANIIEHVNGDDGLGVNLSPIPWLWTKDGDDVVDNCDDSTRDNWAVCGGIPGTQVAETLIVAASAQTFDDYGSVWLMNIPISTYKDPAYFLFHDLSGTADGGSAGGEFKRVSVSTTETNLSGSIQITNDEGGDLLLGQTLQVLCRVKDAGSNLMLSAVCSFGGLVIQTDYIPASVSTTFMLLRTLSILIPTATSLLIGDAVSRTTMTFRVMAKRSSGGAANVDIDYFALFTKPSIRITGGDNNSLGFAYRGANAVGAQSTSTPGALIGQTGRLQVIGDRIELQPGRLNLLMALKGDSENTPTITWTHTYYMFVTPRYSIH